MDSKERRLGWHVLGFDNKGLVSQSPRVGAAGHAPATRRNTSVETDVSFKGTQSKDGGKGISPKPNEKTKQTINISLLSEEQLFTRLEDYISMMHQFFSNTKNVHRELKDTLNNTFKVFKQYAKVRSINTIKNSSYLHEERCIENSSHNTTDFEENSDGIQKNYEEHRAAAEYETY